MAEKPVVEVQVTDIDYVGLEPGVSGAVKILFDTTGTQHIAVVLPPEVLSKLETRLAQVREAMAKRTPRQ